MFENIKDINSISCAMIGIFLLYMSASILMVSQAMATPIMPAEVVADVHYFVQGYAAPKHSIQNESDFWWSHPHEVESIIYDEPWQWLHEGGYPLETIDYRIGPFPPLEDIGSAKRTTIAELDFGPTWTSNGLQLSLIWSFSTEYQFYDVPQEYQEPGSASADFWLIFRGAVQVESPGYLDSDLVLKDALFSGNIINDDTLVRPGEAIYFYEELDWSIEDIVEGSFSGEQLWSINFIPVPEPSAMLILFSGLIGLVGLKRKFMGRG